MDEKNNFIRYIFTILIEIFLILLLSFIIVNIGFWLINYYNSGEQYKHLVCYSGSEDVSSQFVKSISCSKGIFIALFGGGGILFIFLKRIIENFADWVFKKMFRSDNPKKINKNKKNK